MAKKRIVKDYDQLPPEILSAVKKKYPAGYADHLTSYTSADGKKVSSLPFETDDVYYLIRMSVLEAKRLDRQEDEPDEDEKSPLANMKDDFKMDDLDLDAIPEDEADDEFGEDEEEEDSLIIRTTRRGDDDDDEDENY